MNKASLSRWCMAQFCACMGCANSSFASHKAWQEWVLSVGGVVDKHGYHANLTQVKIPGKITITPNSERSTTIKTLAAAMQWSLEEAKVVVEGTGGFRHVDAESVYEFLNMFTTFRTVYELEWKNTPVKLQPSYSISELSTRRYPTIPRLFSSPDD